MRILVLQLARFGDIYQSWPTLHALQRRYPESELHVLVRSRFRDALNDFPGITIHALPTAEILTPILAGGTEDEANQRLLAFLEPLRGLQFDLIVNLSFSPMSSYLADLLAPANCSIRGYCRMSDGHLRLPDDASAYFYAQVGIGRWNRYHITDIFAAVAGVELKDEDFAWAPPQSSGPRRGVLVHLGASTLEKTYAPELWVQALCSLVKATTETVTLIGSPSEVALSETVARQVADPRL